MAVSQKGSCLGRVRVPGRGRFPWARRPRCCVWCGRRRSRGLQRLTCCWWFAGVKPCRKPALPAASLLSQPLSPPHLRSPPCHRPPPPYFFLPLPALGSCPQALPFTGHNTVDEQEKMFFYSLPPPPPHFLSVLSVIDLEHHVPWVSGLGYYVADRCLIGSACGPRRGTAGVFPFGEDVKVPVLGRPQRRSGDLCVPGGPAPPCPALRVGALGVDRDSAPFSAAVLEEAAGPAVKKQLLGEVQCLNPHHLPVPGGLSGLSCWISLC